LYGLAAHGEKGVSAILEMLRREIDVTMALTGVRTIKDISPDILWRPD
jgi:L-lactate dehydrogenase (cytochrome)